MSEEQPEMRHGQFGAHVLASGEVGPGFIEFTGFIDRENFEPVSVKLRVEYPEGQGVYGLLMLGAAAQNSGDLFTELIESGDESVKDLLASGKPCEHETDGE